MLSQFLKNHHTTLPIVDLIVALESKNSCISIKDSQGIYHYSNKNFTRLQGVSTVLNRQDKDLTANKPLLQTIKQHDAFILEEAKALDVSEVIYPLSSPYLVTRVEGNLHPVFFKDEGMPRYILGLFTPQSKLLALDYETIFQFSFTELKRFFHKRSYPVTFRGMHLQFSKREIELIIALVRGLHAGEIATALGLQQTTVESYIQNIKDKLGVSLKSEVIAAVLETHLLGQIIL
ncbi:MAG: LuxR C-terminal-related transcriptional regulator [Tatlockia sp.]|jgi:DNA-binding CsgD family transcriptional regulator